MGQFHLWLKLKKWTTPLMKISIWILVAAFIVLIAWIIDDKPFENKTIVALTFRILLTTGFFLIARKYSSKENQSV
jgi:quinol-cytochrome oxidoreductase complex cytochrome b subunit